MTEWVVVLELQKPSGAGLLMLRQFEELVDRLNEWRASAIFNPDRYALQMRMLADQPSEAFASALVYHGQATASLNMPPWPVVRAEVLTPDELEKEVAYQQIHDGLGAPAPRTARLDAEGSDALYEATRELLRIRSASEAAHVVARFVRKMGGFVVKQRDAGMPTLPFDLSCGQGEPAFAAVESFSTTQLRLQELLPVLVKDAEEAVARLHIQSSQPIDPLAASFGEFRTSDATH